VSSNGRRPDRPIRPPKRYRLRVRAGYLEIVSVHMPDVVVWDYPLPIRLERPRDRAEVLETARDFGLSMTDVTRALKDGDRRAAEEYDERHAAQSDSGPPPTPTIQEPPPADPGPPGPPEAKDLRPAREDDSFG